MFRRWEWEKPLFCGLTKGGKTITGQPLSDKAVVRLVKQAAAEAGLDTDRFSRHSAARGARRRRTSDTVALRNSPEKTYPGRMPVA